MGSVKCKICESNESSNQFEDGDFHHALVKVRGFVLHHLYSDDFVRSNILALDYLSECALA